MAHRKGPWKRRKTEMKEARDKVAQVVLAKHNQDKKENPKSRTKRRSPDEVVTLLPKTIQKEWLDFKIRDPEEWVSKSYNLNRQIIDFVKWVFCEYHVPRFMFDLFVKQKRLPSMTYSRGDYKTYLAWFIAIGQGYSFYKEARDTFTKKEAHLFLNAPSDNNLISNIWWAKCEARNIPGDFTQFITQRFVRFSYKGKFWLSFLDFVKNNENELNLDTLQELVDFLPTHLARNENFSLKGRTLNSLIQLSNEWHRAQQMTNHGRFQQWDGLEIENWSYTNKKEKIKWTIRQLHNSKELYAEGRRMRHCVYSYVSACVAGRTGIFSMESHNNFNQTQKHLTIEVTKDKIVSQAKGRLNRKPNNTEANVLFKWGLEKHLTISQWIIR